MIKFHTMHIIEKERVQKTLVKKLKITQMQHGFFYNWCGHNMVVRP